MLHVWKAPLARATKDVDFLGRIDNSLENLERVVREICTADVEPDGMVFDPATVKTERIQEDADYEGVRVRFVGLLGKARVPMQIDVGFGDVVDDHIRLGKRRCRPPKGGGIKHSAQKLSALWGPLMCSSLRIYFANAVNQRGVPPAARPPRRAGFGIASNVGLTNRPS